MALVKTVTDAGSDIALEATKKLGITPSPDDFTIRLAWGIHVWLGALLLAFREG